ncbi:MAG: hypothetical protein ACOYBP_02465 [Microbacteriaceae bacterium]
MTDERPAARPRDPEPTRNSVEPTATNMEKGAWSNSPKFFWGSSLLLSILGIFIGGLMSGSNSSLLAGFGSLVQFLSWPAMFVTFFFSWFLWTVSDENDTKDKHTNASQSVLTPSGIDLTVNESTSAGKPKPKPTSGAWSKQTEREKTLTILGGIGLVIFIIVLIAQTSSGNTTSLPPACLTAQTARSIANDPGNTEHDRGVAALMYAAKKAECESQGGKVP